MAVQFTSLLGDGNPISADQYVDQLTFTAPDDRPYVVANFAVSIDGHVTVDGRSKGLSDEGDRALFHALRARVDAVLAGASTIGIERYGRMIPEAGTRSRRLAAGRRAEPLAVTVTRCAELPLDAPLFASEEAEVVVFAVAAPNLDGVAAHVHLESYDETLARALATLRHDYGVELVLCEGGPRLLSSMVREGVVDELFLTFSPQLAGSGGPSLLAGAPLPAPESMALRSGLVRDSTLFLRYAISA